MSTRELLGIPPRISFESEDSFIVCAPGEPSVKDGDAISADSSEGSKEFLSRYYPENPNGQPLVKNKVAKRTKATTNDAALANENHLGARTYSYESTHSAPSDVASLSDDDSKYGENKKPHQQETAFPYDLSAIPTPLGQSTGDLQEMGSFFGDQPTFEPGSFGQTLHAADAEYAALEANVSVQAPESTAAKSSNDQHSAHH